MRLVSLLAVSMLAALSSARAEVVGYYGRTKAPALIYSAPSSKGRTMMRVAAGATMVVNQAGPNWFSVVMQRGRVGYVPVQAVELPPDAEGNPQGFTAAQIRSFARTSRPATTVASRGGGVRGTVDSRLQMAYEAMRLEGTTPYKWGGNEIGSGIDCSGFVKKMYGSIGLGLPRTAAEQANVGAPIYRLEDLQAGDRLYFWETKRGKIGHTGIYLGGGYFVHSSSGHNGIARDYLSERWRRILTAARR